MRATGLTLEDLMGTVFLLLYAGHETTVNLIGNGTLALLETPEQLERLGNGGHRELRALPVVSGS